jgi:opacity protein-like surface antigen
MKHIIYIFLFIMAITASCTHAKSKFPQGAWKLDQVLNVSGNKVVKYFPTSTPGSDIKMWSEGHFLFVGRFQNDTSYTDNFGGGLYTLDGNRYEEEIMYHSSKEYIGAKVKMLLELRHDTLIQTYPVNDIGEPVRQNYFIEKYVRLN